MLMLCACNNSKPQEDPQAPTTDTTTVKKAKSDSATKSENLIGSLKVDVVELQTQVGNIKGQLSKDSTTVEELSKEVNKKVDSSIVYVIIGGFAILLILFVVALHKICILRSEMNSKLERVKEPSQKQQSTSTTSSNVNRSYAKQKELTVLEQEVKVLNNKIKALEAVQTKKPNPVKIDEGKKRETISKAVYFGKNYDDLFPDELSASNDLVVFKGEYVSATKVKFQPISLERIKSVNGIEKVITIKGGNIQRAKTMKVINEGTAVKKLSSGKDFWQLETPAVIQIN